MQILGIAIQTLYLYGLLVGGLLTLLYMLFGDVFEGIVGIGDVAPASILNPTVILSFISILSGLGYVFERQESLASLSILILSTLISLVIVSLVHFFILVPLSKVEESTARSIEDFIHEQGKVITTIPKNGIGEVLIKTPLGVSGQIARSASREQIDQGVIVMVLAIGASDILLVEPIKKKVTI